MFGGACLASHGMGAGPCGFSQARTADLVVPASQCTQQYAAGCGQVQSALSTPVRTLPRRKCVRLAKATLMPAGYPNSVNPGFAAYAAWQGVTNLACQANMGAYSRTLRPTHRSLLLEVPGFSSTAGVQQSRPGWHTRGGVKRVCCACVRVRVCAVIASTFLLYAVGLSAGTAIATAGALNW